MRTNASNTPFSASERLARRIGAGWQWLRHNFISQSLDGLKDMKQAIFERKNNLYYKLVMRHLWGRWALGVLILLVIIDNTLLYGFYNLQGILKQYPNPSSPFYDYLYVFIMAGMINRLWPLSLIVGWRIRSFLKSEYYQSQYLVIPQARRSVYHALAISCVWGAVLLFLAEFALMLVSWFSVSPNIREQISFFNYITGIHGSPLFITFIHSFPNFIYRFIHILLFLYLLLIPLLWIRNFGKAFFGLILLSVISMSALFAIFNSFHNLIKMSVNAYSATILTITKGYIEINYLRIFLSGALTLIYAGVLLLLIGWLWHLGRERFCHGRFPIEEE